MSGPRIDAASGCRRGGTGRHDETAPTIVHVVHRFAVGGMENGIVNLVNRLPASLGRHCVVALTDVDPDFAARITRSDTRFVSLHRPAGQTAKVLPKAYRLLRELRPAVVHTRNVATLEIQLAAWLARVPVRIHGEHGWDVGDLGGTNTRMLWLRRAMRPFVHRQIALSGPTRRYLVERVGVPASRVTSICNGVDTERFAPAADRAALRRSLAGSALPADAFVVGAVGRIAAVKNLPMLVRAFSAVSRRNARFAGSARLALVGDGPDAAALRALVEAEGLAGASWMPGMRDDVPDCLRALDVLALPSFVEGISNTVLEALACGVPVVATAVGGNPELVDAGRTGELVTSGDAEALADRIEDYFERPARLREHAAAAREAAVGRFGLDGMVDAYEAVYRNGLRHAGRLRCDPPDPASTEPAAPAPKRGAATRDKRSLTCAD